MTEQTLRKQMLQPGTGKLYKNGLPFGDVIAKALDSQIERIENRKASLIICTGGLGSGKTTFAIHAGDYINKKCNLPPIDIKGPQLAMGGDEFQGKIPECFESKLPVIIYDEAGDYNKRGALTRLNAMLNRTFETFRAFRCIVIMCLPNFAVLDSQLFSNEIPRLLLRLRRNNGENFSTIAGYGLYEINILRSQMRKYPDLNYAWQNTLANFYSHSLDLGPDRADQLDALSTKKKLTISKDASIKMQGLVDKLSIATKLGKSTSYISSIIAKLNIKPKTKNGRKVYFDSFVFDKVKEYLE